MKADNLLEDNRVRWCARLIIFVVLSGCLLAISSIALSGPNAGDFAQNNSCGPSLTSGGSCTVNVTFSPVEGGSLSAVLDINDNALGSPQTVAISATIPDFSLAPNTSPTATVNPGQTATYGINVAPFHGFNQTVTLSCSGAPPESSCTVVPGSVKLDGANTAMATASVSTTPKSIAMNEPNQIPPVLGKYLLSFLFLMLSGLGVLVLLIGWSCNRRQRLVSGLAFLFLLFSVASAISSCGCGNGNGGGRASGTPAGTFTLTVTGTSPSGSSALTHSSKLTLVVQ